jgi:hypothetical protein
MIDKNDNIESIIKEIRENPKSPYSVFLSLELLNRYNERPIEEKHLDFEQWRKMLMLRYDSELTKSERKKMEFIKNVQLPSPKKNKEFYKDVVVPDFIKNLSTKQLLHARFSYQYDTELVYAELANRPHIKNKRERRKKHQYPS